MLPQTWQVNGHMLSNIDQKTIKKPPRTCGKTRKDHNGRPWGASNCIERILAAEQQDKDVVENVKRLIERAPAEKEYLTRILWRLVAKMDITAEMLRTNL